MSQILTILNEIAATSSTNEKQAIIERNKDNKLFRDVLYLAESPTEVYYLAKIPPRVQSSDMDMTIDNGLAILRQMSNRSISGTSAVMVLQDILSSMPVEDAEVVGRVLLKDLRCGIGDTLINKAIPDLIPTPYMGAVPFDKDKVKKLFIKANGKPVESDVKKDCRYVNVIVHGDKSADMVSRQGKKSYFNNKDLIEDCIGVAEFLMLENDEAFGMVLNCELVMDAEWGLSRYTANGIISSVVDITEKISEGKDVTKSLAKLEKKHGMTFDLAVSLIRISVLDFIPYRLYAKKEDFILPRHIRLRMLDRAIMEVNTFQVGMIQYRMVNTYKEAMEHFAELIARGGIWTDGKPAHQVKCKMELNCEMRIVGFNEGEGKYVGMLGSLVCQSEDGLVNADPYAFSDPLRVEIWEARDAWMNKIIEVKCNGLSHDAKGNYSLMHPVYKSERTDKTTADTLEDIKRNQNMVLGLEKEAL